MPQAEAQRAIESLRRQLITQDSVAAAELVRAYLPVWERIRNNLEALLAQVENQQLTFGQVQRLARYRDLLAQAEGEVARYSLLANGQIADSQRAALSLAQQGTQSVVSAALPAGIDLGLLARVNIGWNTLPTEAFEAFLGVAGDGRPLSNLLAPMGARVRAGVADALREGIALGYSPRRTADIIRNKVGMGLTDALRISRTETMRAFREGTRMQYAANPNIVKGYQRIAARSERTCLACIALDGTTYQTNEPLDEHPNGRCALIPLTIGYRDLGLDVPETVQPLPTARDWFRQQPEGTQRAMMGDKRFEAWQSGRFDLVDLAKISHSDIWGNAAVEKPLKELVA